MMGWWWFWLWSGGCCGDGVMIAVVMSDGVCGSEVLEAVVGEWC